jgi:acyl carrier protein
VSNNEDRVREAFVAALGEIADVDPAEVTDEKSLVDDLDVDSLTVVEVFAVLEENLGITIPEEDGKEFATVGSAIRYLTAAASAHAG